MRTNLSSRRLSVTQTVDDDEQLIEAALAKLNDRILQGFYSLCLAPSQVGLQRAFCQLVEQRDAFENWLGTR